MHNILHIFADTTPARTHFSLTRTTAHALARAFLLFAVMVIITPAVWADDGRNRHKVESIDSEFGKNKVFTVTSGSGNRMYVNGTSLLRDNSTNVSGAYQFAFVEDPKSTSEYYLYNVGTEQFVSYKSTTTEPLITNSSDAQHIYVYTPGNSGFPNSKYVLSFNSNIATSTWGTSQTGDGTNESNTTNHIFHLETTSVRINDWVTIGGAGHNSLTITEVPDVTFTDAEIAQAQSILNGTFVYSPSTFAAQRVKITTNSKVYTLLAEDGKYLSATSSGLATSTTNTSTNEQWVFIEDETDNTKVYLYNVGQKKFVLVSGSSLSIGGGSSIGTVKVYTTEDAHNYNVAFGFGSDWTTGPALSTNGVYTSAPSQSNRFQVAEVDGATFTESDMNAAKKRLLTDLTDFSVKTVAAVGLTANTQKYIIYTNPNSGETNYRGGFYADNNGLTSTYKHDSSNPYANASDTHQQFAFVSKSDDDQSVTYLYSVDQERFVEGKTGNSPLNLTNGGSVNPIYVYLTNNFDYNLAFAFDTNANWNVNGSGSGSTNVGINTGNGVFISNYNQLEDLGSRFTADKAGSFTDDELTAARTFLSGTYPAAAITNLTDANNVALSTNTKVYTLQDENGNYLSAGTSGLTTSSTGTSANEQFVFYEDGSGNIYLYSVGKESFITASKGYGTATQFYVFNTTDAHGYTLGLAANATWSTAPIGTGSTTVPDRSNRFQATDVTSSATTYSQDFANVVFSGSYTKSYFKTQSLTTVSGGTASGKVYTLQAENGRYLIANSNGLTTSATEPTNANGQFIFFQNPNATGGTEEVYLYSVGQQKFVKSDGTLVGMTASGTASQLCVFTTGDYHGYNLAFAFGNTAWASATYAVGSGTNVAPLQSNRFKLTEVAASSLSTTMENTTAYAKVVYTGQRRVSLDEVGLSFDCVYNIYTSQSDGALSANSSSTLQGVSLNAKDSHQQFVFHKDENEENKVYLFNVYEERFANKTKGFATGKTDPIYVFLTGNDSYPYVLAFSENPTWGKSLSSTSNGYYVINSGSNVSINDWTNLSAASNHFQISKVDDITYSADFVQKILNDSYGDPVDFSTLGLTTNSVVYNLKNENGAYLSASGSSVASTTATTTSSDANAQFVFYQAPADKSKTYLYSVGRGAFVASDGTYSSTPAALTFYQTSDPDSYSFAIGLNSTWAASVVGNSSAGVIKSTRFQAEEVETPSEQWVENEPATLLSGKYSPITLAEAGIDVNKVYYVVSDVNSNNNHVLMDGHLSSLNGYSRTDESALTTIVNDNSSIMKFAFVTDKDDASKIYLLNVSTSKAVGKTGDMSNEANSPTYQPIYLFATNNYKYPLAFSFSPTWGETDAVYLDANKTDFTHGDTFVSTDATIGSAKRFRIVPMYDDTYSLTLGRAALKGWMTTAFHYKGASGRDFQTNGMQSVSEVHYYYYVNTNRREYDRSSNKPAIDLMLPLMRYLKRDANGNIVSGNDSRGNNFEPLAYFRWYDYRTDQMPTDETRIQKWNESWQYKANSILSTKTDINGRNLGYFATNMQNNWSNYGPTAGNIGVYYNIPSEADNENWEGDIIACDVSRYIDYNDETTANITKFTHEPTLSIRYLYHILPAKRIANAMRDSLCNSLTNISRGRSRSLSDKGVFVFGVRDEQASMNIRADLQSVSQYYFYPLKSDALKTKHIYYVADGESSSFVSGTDFDSSAPVQAQGIEWRVYSSDLSAYRVIRTSPKMESAINIKLNEGQSSYTLDDGQHAIYGLNGDDWKNVTDGGTPAITPKINIGDNCYLVAYVTDGQSGDNAKKCPFFNARLYITDTNPVIAEDLPTERTETYLTSHYGTTVANFQFDDENPQQTQTTVYKAYPDALPVNIDSAKQYVSIEPSPFAWRQYGFVYAKLGAYSNLSHYPNYINRTYTPLHGEYCLYKRYGPVMHDRTYVKTNINGYFMFTDASDESRVLATQDFEGTLCSGSRIFISAWVASTNGITTQDHPELRFTLLGVKKNDNGEDLYTKSLAAVCSGQFRTNAGTTTNKYDYQNSQSSGVWYQVFGVVTLPSESGVNQFSDFRIAIDNFCNSTSGADYAIDDIEIYQSNAKLTVIQIPALCDDDSANEVDIKIKGNLSTLQSLTNASDPKVYYRFVNSDGQRVWGDGFYGTDQNGNKLNDYGIATVPRTYDATADATTTINTGTDHETLRFETGVDGQPEVVLVNQGFSLSKDSTYYVSLSITDPSSATGASWGNPNDICSTYSSNFQLIRQEIQIAGTSGNTTSVSVPCGSSTATAYNGIAVNLTAPDKVNGGQTILSGEQLKFFWFAGTKDEYNYFKETIDGTEVSLKNAVTGYMNAYPNQVFSSTNGATSAYTEAEKALLEKYTCVPSDLNQTYTPTEASTYTAASGSTAASATINYTGTTYTPVSETYTAGTSTDTDGNTVTTTIDYNSEHSTITVVKTTNLSAREIKDGAVTKYWQRKDSIVATTTATTVDGTTTYTYTVIKSTIAPLYASATNSLSGYPISQGTNSFSAIPIVTTFEASNGQTYAICDQPMVITVRGMQTGPGLNLGLPNVVYPASETYRSVRIGLPQIKAMGTTGTLNVPIQHRLWHTDAGYENLDTELLQFTDGKIIDGKYNPSNKLFIINTNDPSIDLNDTGDDTEDDKLLLATINNLEEVNDTACALPRSKGVLSLLFNSEMVAKLHEGYWYEVAIMFVRADIDKAAQGGTICSGETFLTFKIVPEYLTWEPSNTQGYNSNWNRDDNWRRSTAEELYSLTYTDYRTSTYSTKLYKDNLKDGRTVETKEVSSPVDTKLATTTTQPRTYVPMYFSKVTIPTKTTGVYPMMPYVLKNQNGLILRMQNDKGERPTSNIQYDMMAAYDATASSGQTDSTYTCSNFDGNICEQILFKPGGQLRKQQFLRYQRAWVERHVPVNTWSTFTTLMKQTPSGDLYVPKFSAQQTTPSFEEITFTDLDNVYVGTDNYVTTDATKSGITTYGLYGKPNDKPRYSRLRMPIYQRLWGQTTATQYSETDDYDAYDEPSVMLIDDTKEDADLDSLENNVSRNAWSHPFNAMVDSTSSTINQGYGTNVNGMGMAVKVGDDYSTPSESDKWKNKMVLLRLPKSDESFDFYKWSGAKEEKSSRSPYALNDDAKANRYRLGIDYSTDENNLGTLTLTTPSTYPNVMDNAGKENPNGLHYVLVGNPYTSSILVDEFIDANRTVMQTVERSSKSSDGTTTTTSDVYCIWTLEGNVLNEYQYGHGSMIDAGEAFFVKVKLPGRDVVTFTTRMQTDPRLSTTSATRVAASTPSRVYTVENPTDVQTVIASETEPLLCTSPQTGYLRVQSGKALTRVMVYHANGMLVANHKMADPYDDQFFVGSGIAIVRAIATDGTAQTAKIVVR